MADSKKTCKKRKRPSLPTTHRFVGIFTRSKSQIHLHYNRSGKSRTCSVGGGNHQDLQPFVKKHKNSSPAEGSLVGYDSSSVSIKDLRLRRVFSPSSTDGATPNCLDDTENVGKSEVAGNCFDGSQEDCENGDSVKLDMSNQDFVRSTPPDAEIFGAKQVVERNGSESLPINDRCPEKGFHEERNGMNYSIKSVLKPCSGVKLFKTPGSFSYRRLLPYLMDIDKDCSRSSIIGRCQKTEKLLEEKQLLASNNQEALGDKSMASGNNDSGKELNTALVASLTSQENESFFMPRGNGEIRKFELQVSCEDPNLNSLKHDSSSTLEDSHINKENLAAVVSGDKMLADDGDVAKTNVESPCNAQRLEGLDQVLSTASDKRNGEIRKFELQVSCEDPNLNSLKHDSSSTLEDSHINKENLAAVVSGDKMLADDGDVAKTNVESPCNAQRLEGLDQVLSTASDKRESCDYNEVKHHSNDDAKQPVIEGMSKPTIGGSFETQNLKSVDPTLSEMGGNRKCSLQRRFDNNVEVVEQVEDLNGHCVSMIPPDSDMFSKSGPDDCGGNKVDFSSLGTNHAIEKSTNETLNRNSGQDGDKSLDSSPKNNLVPNSCLHLKLSKIPGSFSYRRLLPFLIDLTNDYSCASGNDKSVNFEKSSKEKPLSPFFTSGQDTCIETVSCKSSSVEHYTGDGIRLPVTAATATGCSSNDKPTLSPPKQAAGSPLILDSQQELASLVKHVALDTNQRLETSPENVVEPPAMSSSSLINSGLFPSEESAKSVSCQLPFETEGDVIKSTVKCANHEKQIEADSFVEASNPPGFPTAGLRKGIIKRNPCGCRGICACLNCSSFRLHAERSFEFSRNQMQHVEEMALDLIKELLFLRSILEKSAHGAEDHSSICINQVKEACKKASEAEELAKTRLSQMNYDLNIHCGIPCGQRPRVRFADYVEEQVIPRADSSNK